MRLSKRQLRQIIKEELLREMPVSTARGYGSQNFDQKYPHLVKLADQIDDLASRYGFDDANIEKFDSGIVGVSIDLWGDKEELIVVDQPGKTGPEDHTMGFISYGKYPEAAHGKSVGGIYFKPEDRGRKFGDTSIRQPDRERVYAQILADIDQKFAAAETGTGRIFGERFDPMAPPKKDLADFSEEYDVSEYDRGYQDGFDGYPVDDRATPDYDAGYEDGKLDADLPETPYDKVRSEDW